MTRNDRNAGNADVSIGDIVSVGRDKADRYSKQLKDTLREARTEEDVRLGTYNFLIDLSKDLSINVKIYNERVVLTGGRIDSLFDNVVFEFKKPKHFRTDNGIEEAIQGRVHGEKRKGGLVQYLLSLAINESRNIEDLQRSLSAKIGVGFDGESFVFVRYMFSETEEIQLSELKEQIELVGVLPEWLPHNLDGNFIRTPQRDLKASLRFLYLHLRAISPKEPLHAESVSRRFGEKSTHFRNHISIIRGKLKNALVTHNLHAETFYGEWERVFGKVYGDIFTATGTVLKNLSDEYKDIVDFTTGEEDIEQFIFSIHTYYNIILKLIASELLSALLNPFSRTGTILSLTDEKFKERITAILKGDYFKIVGITNFFEEGFFEWWLHAWDSEINSVIREIISLLQEMEITTSIIKPEVIGDMVKETYHDLMPRSLRHLLGEYFTPDWLADYVIERSGFSGRVGEKFLDPACGSGTFITFAIRKKIIANKNLERQALIKEILNSVTGFDLNPISVIASKTNYLLALGDITNLDFEIKIPVFYCDSILTPAVHAKQKEDSSHFEIDTFCGTFTVPAFNKSQDVENILDVVKTAIDSGFSDGEFLLKIKQLGENVDVEAALDLFHKVRELTEQDKNGLWIPILKNAFAPVYSRNQYDYCIGNPPWVNWHHMSKSYRELTLPIWLSYGIFNKTAYDARTTHDDFAMAFTYVSSDHYLKANGKLSFVLSQSFFKSNKGGEGFRKFKITKNGNPPIPLKVEEVTDLVAVKPFHKVANRASVLLLEKGKETVYPVPYHVWKPKQKVNEHDSLNSARKKVEIETLQAVPIKGTSSERDLRTSWLTLSSDRHLVGAQVLGESTYKGHKGVEPSGAKGIYILKEPVPFGEKLLRICNNSSRGKEPKIRNLGEHQGLVEPDFVFPSISGRNIRKFGISGGSYILVPHLKRKGVHNAVAETDMKVNYTKTYEWLLHWKEVLLETRIRNSKFYSEKRDPFYVLDNVGLYTFNTYKVAWREQNKHMVSSVISKKSTAPLAGKLIIPDSKVIFYGTDIEDDAHYLCAVLNSDVVTEVIDAYVIETQRGTEIFKNIAIPSFDKDDPIHLKLARLSKIAHCSVSENKDISGILTKINLLVTELFSTIKNNESHSPQKKLIGIEHDSK